jgi:hypothetical protein
VLLAIHHRLRGRRCGRLCACEAEHYQRASVSGRQTKPTNQERGGSRADLSGAQRRFEDGSELAGRRQLVGAALHGHNALRAAAGLIEGGGQFVEHHIRHNRRGVQQTRRLTAQVAAVLLHPHKPPPTTQHM